jgi:hypothetical protein
MRGDPDGETAQGSAIDAGEQRNRVVSQYNAILPV